MIFVIDDTNIHLYGDLMDDVYCFRHKFFGEKLGWKACLKPDGRDIDDFDGPGCIHIVLMKDQRIAGYSRLLPTTKPHLQSTVFAHLAQTTPPSGDRIYEWTRFGVTPERSQRRLGIIDESAARLFLAVAQVAASRGILGLLAQAAPMLINRLMACGWDVEPLGLPTEYDGHGIWAVFARLQASTEAATRAYFADARPAIRRAAPPEMVAETAVRLHA